MNEILLRFFVGGVVVSLFAILSDALKPKSLAGVLGAAPSVALATLALTVLKDGKLFAQTEARSMMLGGVAFLVYAMFVAGLLMRKKLPALAVTSSAILLWLATALGLWMVVVQ